MHNELAKGGCCRRARMDKMVVSPLQSSSECALLLVAGRVDFGVDGFSVADVVALVATVTTDAGGNISTVAGAGTVICGVSAEAMLCG